MHDTTLALTLESVASVVDGHRRVAPQPMGTWMSRWWFLYTDISATPGCVDFDVTPLPQYVFAA